MLCVQNTSCSDIALRRVIYGLSSLSSTSGGIQSYQHTSAPFKTMNDTVLHVMLSASFQSIQGTESVIEKFSEYVSMFFPLYVHVTFA